MNQARTGCDRRAVCTPPARASRRSPARAATALALLLGGCAAAPSHPPPRDGAARCEAYLEAVDASVDRAGTGDAGAWRLPGYRHLRSTRFLASFREQSMTPAQLADWLEQLRLHDWQARQVELDNLPGARRRALLAQAPRAGDPAPVTHGQALARCGRLLVARDLADAARIETIRTRARVPDHYSDWQRVLGLYPVTHLIVLQGVRSLHARLAAPFRQPAPDIATLHRWVPPATPVDTDAAMARTLRDAARNPLGVPRPGPALATALLARHAPVWEFEQGSNDDLIGRVRWDPDGAMAVVDTSEPAEYRWLSHTRWRGHSLLQLNYLVWLPARTATGTGDIFAGAFDGVVWRVTLAPDATPLAWDSVHACGCYYLLFPGPAVEPRARVGPAEPVLAPRRLPLPAPGERFAIRVRAGDHYLQQVWPVRGVPGEPYRVLPYADLLRLDDGAGGRHSLFAPDGLLRRSARPERWLLWPGGIASAGAMRRNGTHAVAFVGVRHFDDADLLERVLQPRGGD